MPRRYFEDFSPGATFDLGSTTLSEQEILAFARQYDPQPIHTDPEGARRGPFGGLIASGWQTGSLFMRHYATEVLANSESMGSPGIDSLRWLKPVRPGDTLTFRYKVVGCEPSRTRPDRGRVHGRAEAWNQHGELVMSFDATNIWRRRPSTEDGAAT